MCMSAVRITKNKTIEFNNKIGRLLNQDYIFKFYPNLSDEPNHVMMACGHKDHEDEMDAFVFSIDQLKKLHNFIGDILDSIDSTENAINEYANFISDMCSRIQNEEIKSVSISIGEPVTLDPDEDFFGNMTMHLKYITKNGLEHRSDLISNKVEKDTNDILYEMMTEYLDRGLIESFNFDMDKYNENRNLILSKKINTINFEDLFGKLKEYEESITSRKNKI